MQRHLSSFHRYYVVISQKKVPGLILSQQILNLDDQRQKTKNDKRRDSTVLISRFSYA